MSDMKKLTQKSFFKNYKILILDKDHNRSTMTISPIFGNFYNNSLVAELVDFERIKNE